jgi:predicted nucleic acid-binding protein
MKHLFLDTNVLIDFLADRKPFSIEAAKLFNYSLKKKATIYVSAVSYNNIYYILRQSTSHSNTMKILNELQEWTEMIDVSKEVIFKSLKSEFKDFEDSIQYNCAKLVTKIECIVTRDTKDFKLSTIPTMTPKEALTMIESTGY